MTSANSTQHMKHILKGYKQSMTAKLTYAMVLEEKERQESWRSKREMTTSADEATANTEKLSPDRQTHLQIMESSVS